MKDGIVNLLIQMCLVEGVDFGRCVVVTVKTNVFTRIVFIAVIMFYLGVIPK